MSNDTRYDQEVLWVQTPAGPERITVGGPLLVLPLSGARTGVTRDNATIASASQTPVKANSVQEVCSKFDVRIEGQFTDVDNQTRRVDLPVQDERSFTVDDLTHREATLRRRYIEMRLCDALAEKLAMSPEAILSQDELVVLRESLEELEKSLPEEEVTR